MQAQAVLKANEISSNNSSLDTDHESVENISAQDMQEPTSLQFDILLDYSLEMTISQGDIQDQGGMDENFGSTESDTESSCSSDGITRSTSDKYFTTFSVEELREVDSWRINDPDLQESIEWTAWKLEKSVSNAAFNTRPNQQICVDNDDPAKATKNMSFSRVIKRIKTLTGLKPQKIPCCVKACALYEDSTVRICLHCDEDLYKTVNLVSGKITHPRKEFFYFSPIPQLVLCWAMPHTAEAMQSYVEVMLNKSLNPNDLV